MAALDIMPEVASRSRFKPSAYNIELGPGRLFNTITGAFLELSASQRAAYDRIAGAGEGADDAALRDLQAWGFVLASDIREIRTLEAAWHRSVMGAKPPLLTIAPTMNCNFGCDYCFETHEKGHMSPAVRDGLIAFLRTQLAAAGPVPLTVTWFGGEPLMGLPVILDLSDRLDQLVEQGVLTGWSATMITNGLLATPKTMGRLRRLSSVQVTIDGPREVHDARRVLKHGGKPTFDTICANLAALPDGLPTTIRINVDRRNADMLERCADQLHAAGVLSRPEAGLYLGIVESYEPPAMAKRDRAAVFSNLLTTREFAAVQERFLAHCEARGYAVVGDRPAPLLRGVCQVDNINAYVVDPSGALLKCWAELRNRPDTVANLLDPASWPDPLLSELEQRNPFDDEGCQRCKLLPVCMGGCPKVRVVNRAAGRKVCPPMKYAFDAILARALPAVVPGQPAYVTAPKLLRSVR